MKVVIKDKELRQALQIAPEKVLIGIHTSLTRSAIKTQGFFVRNMPAGASGNLRRSVTFNFKNRLSVRIEPQAQYADYVEFGTRPHYPPIGAITPWARIKGLNPYAVARGIAKHGTKAHPYEAKTAQEAEQYAIGDMSKSLQEVIDEVI